MGIYIKGMEMPKEGSWVTLRVFPDGQCSLYNWCGNDFDFMEHLTAVPVPPHGDLIDRDAYEYPGDLIDEIVIIPADPAEESNMDSFIRIFEEDDEEDGMDSFIRILKD